MTAGLGREKLGRPHEQCDHIGPFLKVLGNNFSHFYLYLATFGKCWFLSKSCCAYSFGNLWKFGLFFISTFGHTGAVLYLEIFFPVDEAGFEPTILF